MTEMMCVCECVYVIYLCENKFKFSTFKVRILAGPFFFKGLFQGQGFRVTLNDTVLVCVSWGADANDAR